MNCYRGERLYVFCLGTKKSIFFIGKDIKEPKAFGIYKNSAGDFVVYKNKSNGERVIRYQGTDEGYAVNELYQRLITTEKIITIRVHRGIPTIRFWMTGHTLQIRMN